MHQLQTIAVISLFLPALVFAGETHVVNEISVSAETGGNSASSGEVIEGTSESHVRVYTEVNGEVIEDIDETVYDDTPIEHTSEYIDKNVEVHTEVSAETSPQTTVLQEQQAAEEVVMEQEVATAFNSDEKPSSGIFTWVSKLMSYVFNLFS
jgi:hypothetical protein